MKKKEKDKWTWSKVTGFIIILSVILLAGLETMHIIEMKLKNHAIELNCGHEKEKCKKYLCIADFYGSTTTGNTYLQKYIIECIGEKNG